MAPIFKIQAVSESGKANSGDKRLVVDLILTNILCQLPARHRADLDMRGAIRARQILATRSRIFRADNRRDSAQVRCKYVSLRQQRTKAHWRHAVYLGRFCVLTPMLSAGLCKDVKVACGESLAKSSEPQTHGLDIPGPTKQSLSQRRF